MSAGGGSPADASPSKTTLASAFVGPASSSKTVHHAAVTSTLRGPSVGIATEPSSGSSTSSLSVATNPQSIEAIDTVAGIQEDDADTKEAASASRPQRPLKILFLSSDTGGGHRASAEALANQFQRLFPGTTYDLFDVWTDVETSWPYYTIKDCYKSFSATPWKWRTLYHVSNNAIYAKFADLHSYYMNEDNIREKMETYDPDVVGEDEGTELLFSVHCGIYVESDVCL